MFRLHCLYARRSGQPPATTSFPFDEIRHIKELCCFLVAISRSCVHIQYINETRMKQDTSQVGSYLVEQIIEARCGI